jgi:hypothetical protein
MPAVFNGGAGQAGIQAADLHDRLSRSLATPLQDRHPGEGRDPGCGSARLRHSKIVIPAKAGIQAADLHGSIFEARAVVGSVARHSGGEGVSPPAAS